MLGFDAAEVMTVGCWTTLSCGFEVRLAESDGGRHRVAGGGAVRRATRGSVHVAAKVPLWSRGSSTASISLNWLFCQCACGSNAFCFSFLAVQI